MVERHGTDDPKCQMCGMPLERVDEYHPQVACHLYRQGMSPARIRIELAELISYSAPRASEDDL